MCCFYVFSKSNTWTLTFYVDFMVAICKYLIHFGWLVARAFEIFIQHIASLPHASLHVMVH